MFNKATRRWISINVYHIWDLNHLFGKTELRKEDIEVTKRLVEAEKIVGIDVLDHIIAGNDIFTSLKGEGHI
ncbi:JAB domain-containing protein [Priestia megaterium]|uniref:JAB domain-containing protein n=1 Tax=Priestia megaterium TaxID=1404 RepID=UPI003A5BEAD3